MAVRRLEPGEKTDDFDKTFKRMFGCGIVLWVASAVVSIALVVAIIVGIIAGVVWLFQ